MHRLADVDVSNFGKFASSLASNVFTAVTSFTPRQGTGPLGMPPASLPLHANVANVDDALQRPQTRTQAPTWLQCLTATCQCTVAGHTLLDGYQHGRHDSQAAAAL